MKKNFNARLSVLLALLLAFIFIFTACSDKPIIITPETAETTEKTETTDNQQTEDRTGKTTIDFYALNDTHGNIVGNKLGVGISKTASYLRKINAGNVNTVFLSSGDMWQGSSESNNTKGALVTEWMNSLGFVSMTLGNHEFDWSPEAIEKNASLSEFPFLAINVYDVKTNERVSYCSPSVIIERSGIKIGIIGAVGDCYSSISQSKVENVKFIVGSSLTALVKAESEKLRADGADIIVYSLHGGYTRDAYSQGSDKQASLNDAAIGSFYQSELSDGYIDLVFEGHQHKQYVYTDKYGVYHLQAGGYNQAISHVSLTYDKDKKTVSVDKAELIYSSSFSNASDDTETEKLLLKYASQIGDVYSVIGTNDTQLDANKLRSICAGLYLQAGLEKWGSEYDIILGGGYMSCRSPYSLAAGDVCYADIQTLFPFDNNIVLCSVSGRKLLDQFINSSNENYFISLSESGKTQESSINPTKTYYIVTDTYSSDYALNSLTVIDVYNEAGLYARDLLAEYIKEGKLESSGFADISSLYEEADGITAKIKGTVISVCRQSFIVSDGTEVILIYCGEGNTGNVKAGDTVEVRGTLATYSRERQISSPSVKIVSHTDNITLPEPHVITDKDLIFYEGKAFVTPIYVKLTGKLKISGAYYNLIIPGSDIVGSIVMPTDSSLDAYDGKNITVEGYFVYVNGSSTRYFNIVMTSFDAENANSPTLDLSLLSFIYYSKIKNSI